MKQLLLGLALIATPAHADRRIAELHYNPDHVVSISGHRGVQTMIEFAGEETIENIALGDSAAWQVTPNKRANLVFVKPLIDHARTNMTVVTDRRRYLFELTNGGSASPALYALRFIYPAPAHASVEASVAPRPVSSPLPAPPVLNHDWHAQGASQLIPAAIYDDGASTFIAWPARVELPAILIPGVDGSEGAVNFNVRGDYLVIDGVAPRYILHIGKAHAVLTNGSPRPPAGVSAPPSTMPDPTIQEQRK
jgi:type IV secretion system protein VirB9